MESDLETIVGQDVLAPFVCNYPPRSAYVPAEAPLDPIELWQREIDLSGADLNIYIHVPFCGYKCGFCNLYTAICTENEIHERYVQALTKQISDYKKIISERNIRTVYVGGGTPTLLKASLIGEILKALSDAHPSWRAQVEEVAIEASPDSIGTGRGEEYLTQLVRHGFNRVNIGVQSLSSRELRSAGRARAGADRAVAAVEAARRAGISNISTDLIIGFHDQTEESWADSVAGLLELRPDTISTYLLTLRPDAWFSRTARYGAELGRSLYRRYDRSRALLRDAGYVQETNVRFCLPGSGGYRQKSLYFGGIPVLGLGAGARSYSNIADYVIGGGNHPSLGQIQDYISSALSGGLRPRAGFLFNNEERVRRQFALNLFDLDLKMLERFNVQEYASIYEPILEKALNLNLLREIGGTRFQLTDDGVRHRDAIAWRFFSDVVRARDREFYGMLAQNTSVAPQTPILPV